MIPAGDAIEYRRLRAPHEHGGVLIDPPLATMASHLADNVALAGNANYDVHGRRLRDLSADARRELLAQARRYTTNYRDVAGAEPPRDAPILITGHQPLLHHPGVWFKNFVLSEIARRHQAHAIHLLIDNDTLRTASLFVPTGDVHDPRVVSVALDQAGDAIPLEERSILDHACFKSFGTRAAATIAPLVPYPLVRDLWPHAVAAARNTANFGQALSQARHQFEARCGLRSWELPLSDVCQTDQFRWFAWHLLSEAPRLRDVYNAALADYRRVNHLRGRTYPVPDLAADRDLCEAPFWIWTTATPRRRQVFVRRIGEQLELTDRGQIVVRLDLGGSAGGERATDQLQAAEARGIKLRPRALVTTLYARLVLGDLLLHGIGGAKYDQLTDALIRRFFGLTPPAFLTVTATAHLPIAHAVATDNDLRKLDHELRDLQFHPEQFCDRANETAAVRELVERKRRLFAAAPPPDRLHHRQRVERFQDFRRINAALQPFVAAQRAERLVERTRLATVAAHHKLLAARDFSFCLFPEKYLCSLLLESCVASPYGSSLLQGADGATS